MADVSIAAPPVGYVAPVVQGPGGGLGGNTDFETILAPPNLAEPLARYRELERDFRDADAMTDAKRARFNDAAADKQEAVASFEQDKQRHSQLRTTMPADRIARHEAEISRLKKIQEDAAEDLRVAVARLTNRREVLRALREYLVHVQRLAAKEAQS